MPLKTIPASVIGDLTPWRASFRDILIDAAGEKVAFIIQVPKDGTIDRVGFRTNTVTSSQTLRVGLETLSSGNPSGTQYGGSAVGTQASPASNTYYEVTLGTPATATKGEFIAIVIQFNSTAGNLNIASGEKWFNQNFPYASHFTASWAKSGDHPIGHIRYSDGTYPLIFGLPAATFTQPSFNLNSSPDEYALRFLLPYTARLSGALLRVGNNGAAYEMVLYDGTTALATRSVASADAFSTGNDLFRVFFNSSIVLQKNKVYRLAIRPTTTTNINYIGFTVNNNAYLDSWAGGREFYRSTRTNLGAWSDTTTERPGIELILDQLHDGSVSPYLRT